MTRRRRPCVPEACAAALLVAGALALAGCGSPENDGPPAITETKAPLPAFPAWSAPMMGRTTAQALSGHSQCIGAFDTFTLLHDGPRPGLEAAGWAWDVDAKAPVARVLFVDANDRVVGAGTGGVSRPDVAKSRRDVTSSTTGWKGLIGVAKGAITAIGVTRRNGACTIDTKSFGAGGY